MTVKSKWKHLEVSDLRTCLAEDEIQKLQQMSISEDLDSILQTQLDQIADTFRAAFQGKGWAIDIRDHFLPSSYVIYALALCRWWCWTRFPNSGDIALDEPRKALFDAALEMLKDPTLPTFEPDYSDDPELSGDTSLSAHDDAALTLPWQRILPTVGSSGFMHPYLSSWQHPGTF